MMELNIQIHDDYYSGVNSEDIADILSQITALISQAYSRSTPETKENIPA